MMPNMVRAVPELVPASGSHRDFQNSDEIHSSSSRSSSTGSCPSTSCASFSILYRKVAMDAAIPKLDDALGVLRNIRFMRDNDDCQVSLTIEPLKNLHDFDRRPRIEGARRLVRQYQRWIVHQSAGQRDTLLLTTDS